MEKPKKLRGFVNFYLVNRSNKPEYCSLALLIIVYKFVTKEMNINYHTGTDSLMKLPGKEEPLRIFATWGDRSGEIDLIWDPVRFAASYIIQQQCGRYSNKWKVVDLVTRSSYTAAGLKRGRTYWFRVAPMKFKTKAIWSEPVKIKVT